MHGDLGQLYRNLGKQLPDGHKPTIKVLETCLLSEDNKEGSTDEEVQKIIVRWKQFSLLRGLYLDDSVSKEFDRFRAAFASGLTSEKGAIIVPPGLDNASIQTGHVNRVQFMQSSRFAGDFKARFHRILCLHSMAIVGLHFAKVSTVGPMATNLKQEDFDVAEKIEHLWIKEDVLAGGKTTEFDLDTQLDGLEVFDFLYMFLLRKLLPHERLGSWIGNDAGDHPFEWRVAGGPNALELPEWYSFMRHCRKVLQPVDLVGLIENRAWAGYHNGPPNKSMYMRVRGMFERDDQNELGFDWNTDFERSAMVRALHATSEDQSMGPEDPSWWDHVRLRLGSPFLEHSVYRYQDEIDEMHQERVREESMKRERMEEDRMEE